MHSYTQSHKNGHIRTVTCQQASAYMTRYTVVWGARHVTVSERDAGHAGVEAMRAPRVGAIGAVLDETSVMRCKEVSWHYTRLGETLVVTSP